MGEKSSEVIRNLTAPRGENAGEQLREYFETYRKLDTALGEITPHDEQAADSILHAQALILAAAADTPASDFSGVMYKLALWRWENPDLDPDLSDISQTDSIAYSAFRDIADLLDEDEVLKSVDRYLT